MSLLREKLPYFIMIEKKPQKFTEIYKKTVGLKYKEKLENLTGLFKMCVNLAKLDEVPEYCQKSPPFHLFLCIHRCYATCMSKKSLITGTIKLTWTFLSLLIMRNILKMGNDKY